MTIGREQPGGPEQARSFEASLEALEQIVQQLESGDLPLEKSLELFEQGVRLSRECQERLSQAERRIEVLLRDNQGRPVVTNLTMRRDANRWRVTSFDDEVVVQRIVEKVAKDLPPIGALDSANPLFKMPRKAIRKRRR